MSEFYAYNNLIEALDQKIFDELNAEIKVDKCNHKITGQALFSILLYNIIETNRLSLRVMEESFNSHTVNIKHKNKAIKMSKSGIAHRLSTIDSSYFEKLLQSVVKSMSKHFKKSSKYNVIQCDSTVITLSSKLAKCGASVASGPRKQVKMTMALNKIPVQTSISAGSENNISEEISLKALIKSICQSPKEIFVFDRGLTSRKAFLEFTDEQKMFVTRIKHNSRYNVLQNNLIAPIFTKTLEIIADQTILFLGRRKPYKTPFRLIEAKRLKDGSIIQFATNIHDLSAEEITEIYRSRWDIEVFFKFIKQHLNAKHFLSRSENGVKVVLYVMLIAATLMLTFKHLNKIESYLITKMRLSEQIKRLITYHIILLYENRSNDFKVEFLM